ncbi:response regulator [Flavobacterium sp.]|uniref:hybrid sensor histidine kinase/response regulator transcription factor n=1 Tax=Flavobacterium sp. TaxID=239 RepID=UPI0026064013|nr:response regulator [Flavobacterium sp.]MDD2986503.1 response regulator [Flavobacterium sp.]
MEAVSENKDRILKIVDQLQELTLVELDKYPLLVKEGNLELLISSLLHSYNYLAQEKGIQLTSSIKINNKAWFNDDILYKIFTNLLSNVIKFCPTNGLFHFTAILDSDLNLQIIVKNEIEKPIENPSQLFDRFYRENFATEGSGIGLALAKELAELHKGSLTFEDSQKNVAIFILQIPLHKSNYISLEIEQTTPNTEITSLQSESDLSTILIVEDHRELRKVLVELFSPTFQVVESSNGQDALEIAKRELPNIILSDVMMPKMNGFELCHELKTNVLTSHIPIILLTAKTDNEAEWHGISEGADAYIKKPFRADLLQLKVKKLLENRKLLTDRYKNSTNFKPTEFEIPSTEMLFMEKLQTIIDEKLSDCAFGVSQFCEFMEMSRMQLHRKLKAVTGLSTTDFMRINRLKTADALLQNSDLQIAEIGYLCGFNSPSYFIKLYKEAYQITPSERRK